MIATNWIFKKKIDQDGSIQKERKKFIILNGIASEALCLSVFPLVSYRLRRPKIFFVIFGLG
jgi:hypothetical protein